MRGREQFTDWKSGDDYESMRREIRSLQQLKAEDSDGIDEDERARVMANFTATSLDDVEIEPKV